MFIDTHTHLNDGRLLPDADEVVRRALAAGVGKMIQADVDSTERPSMYAVGKRWPGVVYQMLGLYPGSVHEDWKDEIDRMMEYRSCGPVAVGEIGLDYHEGKEEAGLQKEALRVQLELASEWDLPINIHLRDAWEDIIAILKDCRHLHLRGNFHCFSGSYEIYERLSALGDFYVGIGGVVTFRNASLAQTIRRIPLERILLETDAPYLAPVPHRGERNESSYIPIIASKIALEKGATLSEVEETTTRNALKLFNL